MKRMRLLTAIVLGLPTVTLAGGAPPEVRPPASPSPPPAQAATLDRVSVPASGTQSALLKVPAFGRYAVTVTSAQGMGLEIVDRMAGPGPVSGEAGQRDGRIDAFLERGEYQVLTFGHRRGSGTARLAVRHFAEKNPNPPLLPELKMVSGSLADLEQASFWIEVTNRRQVALEAAGRALADLRLWKDGAWLLDAAPETQVVQPEVGRPLLVCRLTADLEPGLYLAVAYGGPPQPWAEESDQYPFHLRMGIPQLGSAGRQRHVVSPFGIDRYLVPGAVNYFRLELPEARPARLGLGWWEPKQPFAPPQSIEEITKKSVPPIAESNTSASSDHLRVVTVEAPAGQVYVLQHFEVLYEMRLGVSGDYWISSVRSGHPQDAVDATAIMVDWTGNVRHIVPMLTETVELDAKTAWARRANLLGTLTLFLQVKDTGTYETLATGVKARFRIEPFLVTHADGYKPPALRESGALWELDAGFYVLTVEPETVGVVEMAVRPRGLLDAALQAIGFGREGPTPRPVRSDVRFTAVTLHWEHAYTIYLNQAPEVKAGIIVRRLPLDLTDPLVVAQMPGETVEVPFRVEERGVLRAEAVDGQLLEMAVDGGPWQRSVTIDSGDHRVAVRHTGADTLQYALAVEPLRLRADTPLPPLPDSARAALPDFPVLTETRPHAFDLEQQSSSTRLVKADRPALYRLETTGLLATHAALRTRTITSLAQAFENGTGRNALLQEYLREGDYQVTVATRGQSAGHLGLALTRTQLIDGGFITSRLPARIALHSGEAVAYHFKITKPGTFRVRSLGLGRRFRCRIEDEAGWPLSPPGGEADLTREYDPGTYRLVILPEPTDARVVTLIEPVAPLRRLKGHGPHLLALNRPVDHVWTEPEAGAERVPDVWEIPVPAPITASVRLTGGMEGRLLKAEGEGATVEIATVATGRDFQGPLAAGRYRLEVRSVRRDNRAPYQVAVGSEELVPGLDRALVAPLLVPVSIGETGLIELTSFGSQDVRARLFDASGHLVAENDDRPGDWNFAISQSLAAGRYALRIDPVGAPSASCTVSARARGVVEKPALAPPAAMDLALGRDTQIYPLTLPEGAEVLLTDLKSTESVGVALEASAAQGWRVLATSSGREARLEVPLLAGGSPYRLRVWSVERRGSPARLRIAAATPHPVPEERLARGVSLTALPGPGPMVGIVAIALTRPGIFRAEPGSRWSSRPGTAMEPAGSAGVVAASSPKLWVVADLPKGGQTVQLRAARLTIPSKSGQTLLVDVPAGVALAADVATSGGPVLVRATSETGQPGVQLAKQGTSGTRDGDTMAVATRSAVSVALDGRNQIAWCWSATPPGDAIDVRMESRGFASPSRLTVTGPSAEAAIAAETARAYELPQGAKRFRLALDQGVVAVLSKDDQVTSIHWAGDAPLSETTTSQADRVTLLNPSNRETRFALEWEMIADGALPAALAPGLTDERAQGVSGTRRLLIGPAPSPATVHVRGDSGEATLIGRDGQIVRGRDIPADPAGGTLLVPHGPGVVLTWVDRPGQEAQDLWARSEPVPPSKVMPPASVVLSGSAQAFRVKVDSPGLLRVRTVASAVILLKRGDLPPAVDVHPNGADIEAYLPAGEAEVRLRAFSGAALWGTAELAFAAATPIGEGLGPETLLPPGTTRLYSFEVARAGSVGVGVKASVDVIEATLLSPNGERLGSGVVQMPYLEPGPYLLALRAPDDTAPVRVQPAVAGIAAPGTGPPADVIRSYLEPEETTPSFSARRVTQPPPSERSGEEMGEGEQPATEEEAVGEEEESGEEPTQDEPGPDRSSGSASAGR